MKLVGLGGRNKRVAMKIVSRRRSSLTILVRRTRALQFTTSARPAAASARPLNISSKAVTSCPWVCTALRRAIRLTLGTRSSRGCASEMRRAITTTTCSHFSS